MAILNAESAAHSQQRPSPQPGHKPPLFIRTVIPQGAVTRSISCSLLPPHALSRTTTTTTTASPAPSPTSTLSSNSPSSSPPSLQSCRQLVMCTTTSIQLFEVHDATLSIRPLSEVMLFTSVYNIAAVSTPVPGRDLLVVLSSRNIISFMQFDDATCRLRCAGQSSLDPFLLHDTSLSSNRVSTPISMRSHLRLLVTHSRKRIVAVASLKSQISVFPVIFLPKHVNAGKIASVPVDGVILSIDFLETDSTNDDDEDDVILIALLQRGKDQMIALYSVGVTKDSPAGGGLSVVPLGSMITCAAHPDDIAVARATSKFAGRAVDPVPNAVGVSRISGCPYLFAVFVKGKVIVGDARSVIENALFGDDASGGGSAVRIEDDVVVNNQPTTNVPHSSYDSPRSNPNRGHLRSTPSNIHSSNMSDDHDNITPPTSPDLSINNNNNSISTPHTPEVHLSSSTQQQPSTTEASGSGTPTGPSSSTTADGFVTPVQRPVRREPPNAPLQTRRTTLHRSIRNDMAIPPSLVRRTTAGMVSVGSISAFQLSAGAGTHRSIGEDCLSFLYVPAYVARDIDDSGGVATTWVDARDHFRISGRHSSDTFGIYFVMESGALHILKWSLSHDDDDDDDDDIVVIDEGMKGSISFKIPQKDRTGGSSGSSRVVDGQRERERLHMRPKFSVEYVGDVGPAVSIAALDRRLLFVANDGADGSLRRLHLPNSGKTGRKLMHDGSLPVALNRRISGRSDGRRYGLEVRQEFLNMSPISDFVIAHPTLKVNNKTKLSKLNGGMVVPNTKRKGGKQQQKQRQSQVARRRYRWVTDAGGSSTSGASTSSSVWRNKIMELSWMNDTNADDINYELEDGGDDGSNQLPLDHVLDGRKDEAEMIVCSGIGRYGSIRLIRPGAPVSVFASTERSFLPCNNMWSVRFTKNALFDAAVVMTFAQATRFLLSVPGSPPGAEKEEEEEEEEEEDVLIPVTNKVGSLIDGTDSAKILSDCRSICFEMIENGVIAQVHEDGIRLIFLKKAGNVNMSDYVQDGILTQSICDRTMDWTPPNGSFISVGTIGAGFILISVMQKQKQDQGNHCMLYLLKCYPGDPALGLCVVSSTSLEHELSCIEIPAWTSINSESDFASPHLPPMTVLGTYAPSVEVRLLGPTLERIAVRSTFPWCIDPTRMNRYKQKAASLAANTVGGTESNDYRRGSSFIHAGNSVNNNFSEDVSLTIEIMTGVPESLCALEMDRRKMIFAGLRDGSVMLFSLVDDRDGNGNGMDKVEVGSPNAGASLAIRSHRKIGQRPVVVKSVLCAIGRVIIGQAERPWMCAGIGGTGKVSWTPLAFKETRALCAYSVPGAGRCFAVAGDDDAFYICGLRRKSPVSVRSIHVGATPRRVLSARYPRDSIVVATSDDIVSSVSTSAAREAEDETMGVRTGGVVGIDVDYDRHGGGSSQDAGDDPSIDSTTPKRSELLLYNRRDKTLMGSMPLMEYEVVHVLINWMDFIIVGTSLGSRSYHDSGSHKLGRRGRLLLFMICDDASDETSSSTVGRPSSSKRNMKFELCCEMILPGAIIAGAVSPNQDFLAVSCNKEVLVFTLIPSRSVMIQVARASARTLVVGLSIKEDIVCIVDRKDSISFFQLKAKALKLVRDRGDHTRRMVSDAALVDRTLAVAIDRSGGLFSIGYQGGDDPPKIDQGIRIAAMKSPLWRPSLLAGTGARGMESGAGAVAAGRFMDNGDNAGIPERSESDHSEEIHVANNDNEVLGGGVEGGDTNEDNIHDADVMVVSDDLIENDAADEDVVEADDVDEMDNDDAVRNGDVLQAEAVEEIDADLEGVEGIAVGDEWVYEDDEINEAVLQEEIVQEMMEDESENAQDENEDHRNENRQRRNDGVPRNLISHHSFNMRDPALRLRIGTFSRAEKVMKGAKTEDKYQKGCVEKFFSSRNNAAFCGTLGGAIVSAVGMSAESFALLTEVEDEMGLHSEVVEPALGSCHKKVRAAYGPRAVGAIDGDLLCMFEGLSDSAKLEIASRVGHEGEQGIMLIEGMIQDLCDRVA